jgi:hypothetical protein
VTLSIGNPFYATYSGFKLTAKWNTKYDWMKFTAESYGKWQQAQKEKDIQFTDSLAPGKWNKVDVLLPSTTGDQLGYFEISMNTSHIILHMDK